ncbi:unnamed protein product [Symbiodinium natans]|uniref:Tyrosine-protein kinase ephrin type A/B receptor-like domain-containing protein n=1 Tax=Symbiodinium natans TaxID=878477 RepID=A0A812PKJ9_9DINO|nr:unnamed protein product [Symbiodinium natans]
MAWLVLVAVLFPSQAGASCLPEAIDIAERKYLTNLYGESYPMGVYVGNWDASFLTSHLLKIIVEERMGFHAEVTGPGPDTLSCFYALLGCKAPGNSSDRGCGQPVTYNHINLEAWSEGYQNEWKLIQSRYASMAPVDVGSMGYEGVSSHFIRQSVRRQAYHEGGTVLDFYRGWNMSWSQPSKYFDDLASISRSLLVPCAQTRFMSTEANQIYLRITGDEAGVETLPDGTLAAVCPDDYFWLSPTCRDDSTRCVPYVTGGTGWGVDDIMQKVTSYDMPVAIGVARSWSTLPRDVNMLFYWWVPDTTFLDLDPVEIVFPPYDFRAYTSGDKRTVAASTAITKIVSQDLVTLAPSVEDLVRNLRLGRNDVMNMLKDMQDTGDSYATVACRWLQSNPSWQDWLPDRTKCSPGFGLYDTTQAAFTGTRADPTFLECRACVSGRYSAQLHDAAGITHVCEFCAPGTSQASGAALQCEPCELGKSQNNSGSQACNRCKIGEYQDEPGSSTCKVCPGGTTLGLGSLSLEDCGCPRGFIDASASTTNLSCVECGEGLDCPALATLRGLVSGSSDLGPEFVASILPGFYSNMAEPLDLYRCVEAAAGTRCPGGIPATCTGLLNNTACTDCPSGRHWDRSEGQCQECTPWQQLGWVLAVAVMLSGLVMVYYMMTAQSTAKASVLFTTTCAFGMTISSLQSVGIIGTMTVQVPEAMKAIYAFLQVFLLDFDNFAFSCVAGGSASTRYIVSVLVFPGAVGWLVCCYYISKLSPKKLRWEAAKAKSTIGALLQLSFSTMSTISMAPMMCFSHPNGVFSLLKYPSITCGTEDHTVMLIFGVLLLLLGVMGFLAACTYAVIVVPRWSRDGQHANVKAFRFLLFRFRLDSWWFGLLLLLRGPLMSLPIALATDYPPIQVMCVMLVFLVVLIIQSNSWPWKVPLLNVLDCFIGFCITMLVAANSFYLGALEGSMKDFADAAGSVIMGMMGAAVALLFVMTVCALTFRAALGGQKELIAFNLQRTPAPSLVAETLQSMSAKIAEMDRAGLARALSALGVYDNKLLLASVSLLDTEVVQSDADQTAKRFCFRISSASFGPPPAQNPPAKNVPSATEATEAETAKEAEVGQSPKSPSEGDLSPSNVRTEEPMANAAEPGGVSGSRKEPRSLCEDTQQAYI